MVVRGVERNLEVIGEITRHVPDEMKAVHPDIPWNDMLGMRNILAHGYDVILEDALWLTATKDLPILTEAIKKLQAQL